MTGCQLRRFEEVHVPGKRLPMRKISEVLRLRAQGRSIREIAASVGVGHTAVGEYLRRAEAAGLAWPLPEGVGAEELDARLFPPPAALPGAGRPVPEWREVHRELKSRKGVTRRLLWLEWREAHPDGWGYSQLGWHYEQWLGAQDVVMRLSYPGGEAMFVDFSGDRAAWFDPEGGEEHTAEVFVAVLGCSGKLFVQATPSQDLASWVGAHVGAWEAFGGVCEVTVPDNLRAGVSKACFYDPEINPTYAELAAFYDTVVLPARVRRPTDKAWATDCTSFWFGSEDVVHGFGSRVIAAVAVAHILPRAVGPRRRPSGRTRRSTSGAVLARRVPRWACHTWRRAWTSAALAVRRGARLSCEAVPGQGVNVGNVGCVGPREGCRGPWPGWGEGGQVDRR